ncbi:MAG: hypothetical protein NVS3B14_05730 [Ktedonobacteraceae bacterium]
MGHELYCEFLVHSNRKSVYWWPLIFEAMHWRSFDFSEPGELAGTGYYYYISLSNEADTDFVKASFRTVWNEINTETSQMLISLWYASQQSFPIDVSIEEKEVGIVKILLSLNDAYLIDLPLEQASERLKQMLNCAKSIDEMCKPFIGKMYWEDVNRLWALFGDSTEVSPFMKSEQEGMKTKFIELRQPDGRLIYLLDPVPIKVRGGWDFVSLTEHSHLD